LRVGWRDSRNFILPPPLPPVIIEHAVCRAIREDLPRELHESCYWCHSEPDRRKEPAANCVNGLMVLNKGIKTPADTLTV
jgi:hypothetical protein